MTIVPSQKTVPIAIMDQSLLLVGAAGVLSHHLYFKRGEHHLYPLRSLLGYTVIVITIALALSVSKSIPLYDSARTTTGLVMAYLAGLYLSLILYRAYFHPLQHIPGPYGARISGLWFSFRLRRVPAYKDLRDLHARYGPIVRVGPSNVSIIHPQAVTQIYGPRSKCIKSSFYDNGYPMGSLHAYRSRSKHDQRRRVWSTGFSDARLRGYESRIRVHRQKLFNRLISLGGKNGQAGTTDISTWFNFYSYDVMGDLAFAHSFGMLDTRSNHWAIDVLLAGIVPFGYYLPSWVFRCLVTVPSLSKDFHRFVGFATQTLIERMNVRLCFPSSFDYDHRRES